MTNKEIARVLKSTAAMIELTGGNPFRSRAMANAARTIERLDETILFLLDEGKLTAVKGIGAGLAAQIKEVVETGTFEAREDLIGAIPAGLMEILRIKGLGAKKVRSLWQQLGITTITELEQAAASGQLASLDGFAEKTQQNILTNIHLLRQYLAKRRYADIRSIVDPLIDTLRATEGVNRAEIAGELRRKMETIGEVLILIDAKDISNISAVLASGLDAESLKNNDSESAWTGTIANGIAFEARLVPADQFGNTLWRLTGSDSHVTAFIERFGEPGTQPDESTIYGSAGLDFVAPELREDADSLDAAASKALPNLIQISDLKGTLHNHSTYSDGAHTLKQMADAAQALGLQYFGICDHSQSLTIANGLQPARIAEQQMEIETLNSAYQNGAFKIFSGIESDILGNGDLDYTEEVLDSFDFIVASVHSRLNMPVDEATERVLTAIRNPYTSILGHPTGRILLVREGYPLDFDRVLDACAQYNVAIELNASPYRLDLDWRWLREATRRGILISINPDAHAMEGLRDSFWGVEAARKGWLTADQCLNALPLDAFEAWISQQQQKRQA